MQKIISSKIFIFSGVLLFILGFGILQNGSTLLNTKVVEAASTDNVTGWAWSSNVGWISFNSTNCDSDSNGFIDSGACGGDNTTTVVIPYGVNITQLGSNAGDFSGYAWSSNVGWVSFNRSDTGNPPGAPYQTGTGAIAKVNPVTGSVTGWARVLAGKNSNSGWDGWVKLSGTATDGSAYGVKLDISTGAFNGYAWGGDVVGWINFNPAVGGVNSNGGSSVRFTGTLRKNQAPNTPSVSGPTSGTINTSIAFKISASDPDKDDVKYLIDWDNNGSIDQTLPSTGFVTSNTTLTANKTWTTLGSKTFEVRAEDSKGGLSSWITKTILIQVSSGNNNNNNSGVCGDNVCNASTENFVSCPTDCRANLKEF